MNITSPFKPINKHYWLGLTLILIVGLGAFLRLYRIEDTLMFQGDQGRDAIVAKQIIKDGKFTLIGPVTSVGNMYLGPFYYYFMAPLLLISYPDPIGPAIGVALFNIISILIVFLVSQKLFGNLTAITASFLYSIMLPAVEYSRFSWNPNIAPVFGILILYGLHQSLVHSRHRYLILSWISFAIVIQLHYIALLAGPPIAIISLYSLLSNKDKSSRREIISSTLIGTVIFLSSLSPLIIFDFRHDRIISRSFAHFINTQDTTEASDKSLVGLIRERNTHVSARLMQIPGGGVDRTISMAILIAGLLLVGYKGNFFTDKRKKSLALVLTFLLTAILGTSLYSGSVYDHYLTYIYAIVALYYAVIIIQISKFKYIGPIASFAVIVWISFYNLNSTPVFSHGQGGTQKHQLVADQILEIINPGDYNITLIGHHRDFKGMNYRYFLEISDRQPLSPEEYLSIPQLIVIDEVGINDPFELDIFEIQATGLDTVTHIETVSSNLTLYRLE